MMASWDESMKMDKMYSSPPYVIHDCAKITMDEMTRAAENVVRSNSIASYAT